MKITLTINGTPTEVEINETEKSKIYQAIDREYKKEDVLACIENDCFNLTKEQAKEVENNIELITDKYKKMMDDTDTEWISMVETAVNYYMERD